MAEVEETSSGSKKIESSLGVSAGTLEDAAPLAGPLFGLFEVEQQGKPDGQMIVAKAAWTLLQVGLQVKDGVAVLGVAGAGNFAQLLRNRVPLA